MYAAEVRKENLTARLFASNGTARIDNDRQNDESIKSFVHCNDTSSPFGSGSRAVKVARAMEVVEWS